MRVTDSNLIPDSYTLDNAFRCSLLGGDYIADASVFATCESQGQSLRPALIGAQQIRSVVESKLPSTEVASSGTYLTI